MNLWVEASANLWGNRDEGVEGWYVRGQQTAVSTNSDTDEEALRESEDVEEESLKWGAWKKLSLECSFSSMAVWTFWAEQFLWGAILGILGCLAGLLPTRCLLQPLPSFYNQKCLQTLSNVPQRAKSPWFENHCLDGRKSVKWLDETFHRLLKCPLFSSSFIHSHRFTLKLITCANSTKIQDYGFWYIFPDCSQWYSVPRFETRRTEVLETVGGYSILRNFFACLWSARHCREYRGTTHTDFVLKEITISLQTTSSVVLFCFFLLIHTWFILVSATEGIANNGV